MGSPKVCEFLVVLSFTFLIRTTSSAGEVLQHSCSPFKNDEITKQLKIHDATEVFVIKNPSDCSSSDLHSAKFSFVFQNEISSACAVTTFCKDLFGGYCRNYFINIWIRSIHTSQDSSISNHQRETICNSENTNQKILYKHQELVIEVSYPFETRENVDTFGCDIYYKCTMKRNSAADSPHTTIQPLEEQTTIFEPLSGPDFSLNESNNTENSIQPSITTSNDQPNQNLKTPSKKPISVKHFLEENELGNSTASPLILKVISYLENNTDSSSSDERNIKRKPTIVGSEDKWVVSRTRREFYFPEYMLLFEQSENSEN